MGIELLAVPLGVSLFSFCVLALVVNAFTSFVTYASTYKRHTGKQMLISLTVTFSNALAAGGGVFVSTIRGILRWWIMIAALVLVFSCINVTVNEYPSVWTGSVRFYNRYLGPFVHIMVTVPLYLVDILLRALLPLWDSVVWFGKALLVQGLLPVVLDEGDEKCSGSSQDLPWPDMMSDTALYQSSRYSVGTIPNMPSQTSSTYPATDSADDNFKMGPWQEMGPIGHEWGTKTDKGARTLRCVSACWTHTVQ